MKLIVVIVPLCEIYKKIGHSDLIYMTHLGHLERFLKYHHLIEYSMISFLH